MGLHKCPWGGRRDAGAKGRAGFHTGCVSPQATDASIPDGDPECSLYCKTGSQGRQMAKKGVRTITASSFLGVTCSFLVMEQDVGTPAGQTSKKCWRDNLLL